MTKHQHLTMARVRHKKTKENETTDQSSKIILNGFSLINNCLFIIQLKANESGNHKSNPLLN